VADYKTFFAQMSVDAISMLGDDLSVSSVGIKKVTGGSVTDTMLVEGVCFKKCFSYAGFEQQPKRFENAIILLLNLELELKAEKDNAEVRITDPDQYQSIVDAEWNIIYVPRLQTNCRIILFKEVQCTADAVSVDASTFSTVRSIMISSSSSSVISAPARRSWS
jgi:chaperonin GroEL (HSP60 family)